MSATVVVEVGCGAESIEDCALSLSRTITRGGRVSWFVLAAVYSLEVVGAAAMVACFGVGGAVTLPDLGRGALAVAALAAIRAQFIFVVEFAIFEFLLLAAAVLTASCIRPLVL